MMGYQFSLGRPAPQDLEFTKIQLKDGKNKVLRSNVRILWRDCPNGLFGDSRVHMRLEETMDMTGQGLERGDLLVAGLEEAVFVYTSRGNWVKDSGKRHLDNSEGHLLYHPDSELTSRQWVLCGSGSVTTWEKKGTGYNKRHTFLQANGLVPETKHRSKWERATAAGLEPQLTALIPFPQPYDSLSALSNPSPHGLTYYHDRPNLWISNIRSHLERIFPVESEPLVKCCRVLDLLIYRPERIDTSVKLYDIAREGFYKDYHVNPRNLWEDLVFGAEKIEVEEAFTSQGTWSTFDLMVAFTSAGVGSAGFSEGKSWVLGAINVPSHENGTRKCGIVTPEFLKADGVITEVSNGYFDRGSAFTSAGFLTEPHWDVHGVPELVTHMFGRKLWLVWPPTAENIEKAKPYFVSPSNAEKLTVEKALEVLGGLQIAYCTEENQSFVLEPYAIHAVLSETPCIHFSKLFTSYSRFHKYEETHRAVVDTLYKGCLENGRSIAESSRVIDVLEDGRTGFKYWDVLLKEKPDHVSASETRKQLKNLKKHVTECIKELRAPPW